MPGDIGEVEQQVALVEQVEVEEVTGEIEVGGEPVVAVDAAQGLRTRRQHLALDLAAGLLVQAQHRQVGLQGLVELLEARLVPPPRLLQGPQPDHLADHAAQ